MPSLAYSKMSVQRRLLLCGPGANRHTGGKATHHLMQGLPLLRFEEPSRKCIIWHNHLHTLGQRQCNTADFGKGAKRSGASFWCVRLSPDATVDGK